MSSIDPGISGYSLPVLDTTVKTNALGSSKKNASPEEIEKRLEKIKKTCADLESVFINSLIKTMRQSFAQEGALEKAPGADIYDSMADQQLAVFLSRGTGLGLGRAVYKQMVRREGLEDYDTADEHLAAPRQTTGRSSRLELTEDQQNDETESLPGRGKTGIDLQAERGTEEIKPLKKAATGENDHEE
jgi:Rod binding domain-containing protein